MVQNDNAYFAKRAEAELEQAQRATEPKAAQVHQQLAQAYLERSKLDASVCIEKGT